MINSNKDFKGNVKSIFEIKYMVEIRGGSLKRIINNYPPGEYNTTEEELLKFNIQGKLLEHRKFFSTDEIYITWRNTYNVNGTLIKIEEFEFDTKKRVCKIYNEGQQRIEDWKDLSGNFTQVVIIDFDSIGNVLETNIINSAGINISCEKKRYDQYSRKILEELFYPSGKVFKFEYSYSENLIYEKWYDRNDNLGRETIKELDEYGNVITEKIISQGGKKEDLYKYLYIYDKYKNWVERTEIINGETKYKSKRKIYYQ